MALRQLSFNDSSSMDIVQSSLGLVGGSTVLLFALGVLIIVVLTTRTILHVHYDPREPPIIPQSIPYIGHLIGIFRHGAAYFATVNQKNNYPIYTLPTLTSRTYIVTSPSLAAIVQRSSKTTSFYSAIMEVTKRLVAFDRPSMDIIWNNVNREQGNKGLMPESHDMIASVLGPGPTLNNITKVQLEVFSATLGKLGPDTEVVELYSWVREVFTTSNTKAIYGPENLFAMHPELIEDFKVFEEGMLALLVDFLPAITARKPYLARQRILDGLIEFVEKERYKKASTLIQQRVSINLKHGLSKKMTGHAELIMLFAIVGNAVPTTFWLLGNLFSRPDLLAEVRQEIERAVTVTEVDGREKEMRTIHVDMLKSVAPVLLSAYRETLRMVANLSSVRWILSDTLIAEKYILKKDSICQIASGVIHVDESIWGAGAGDFKPTRFMTTSEATWSGSMTEKTATAPLPKNVPSAAFRAFGGGSVICPGRHFAQSEIIGFVAAVVMGFNVEKPGGGAIHLPERNNEVIPLAVMKPAGECRVAIERRKGLQKVKWELEL